MEILLKVLHGMLILLFPKLVCIELNINKCFQLLFKEIEIC